MPRRSYSEQERKQVREALLEAMTRCIAERGLIHSSVDLLCREVCISKTFFYSLFPSKEELVLQSLRCQQPRLLRYAQELRDDPSLTWRQGVERFLRDCCRGEGGIAVLSIEEEQEVYRCLTPESFRMFRRDQRAFFGKILAVFGMPPEALDPRLFGSLAIAMMMVYKAIPETMPFLFPETAEDMMEFQIRALADEMERAAGRRAGTP